MKRIHYLAAEFFNYSYDNYESHLGIGNVRFEELMPQDAAVYERAEKEGWSDEQIAAQTGDKIERIPRLREKFREAMTIVDAEDPAESFLHSVRAVVEFAVKEGLDDEKSINNLIGQICYRTADLSFILKENNEPLWKYSQKLRSQSDDISDIDHDFDFGG